MLLSEVDNVRQLVELLGDEEFIRALTEAESLVQDVNATLDRVELVEDEAAQAVEEANETLTAVDRRLDKVDETINLLEAKIEAGFSLGFFVFAVNFYLNGDLLFAASLSFMGLLGAGQLLVTIRNIPQVEKLRWGLGRVAERFGYPGLAARLDPERREDAGTGEPSDRRTRDRDGS